MTQNSSDRLAELLAQYADDDGSDSQIEADDEEQCYEDVLPGAEDELSDEPPAEFDEAHNELRDLMLNCGLEEHLHLVPSCPASAPFLCL